MIALGNRSLKDIVTLYGSVQASIHMHPICTTFPKLSYDWLKNKRRPLIGRTENGYVVVIRSSPPLSQYYSSIHILKHR